jgi:hypothetical protein
MLSSRPLLAIVGKKRSSLRKFLTLIETRRYCNSGDRIKLLATNFNLSNSSIPVLRWHEFWRIHPEHMFLALAHNIGFQMIPFAFSR